MKRFLSPLALALWLVLPVAAEETAGPAILVADSVYLDGKTRLVAEGRVEALSGDTRIIAQKITYDRTSGTLSIEGPIRIEKAAALRSLLPVLRWMPASKTLCSKVHAWCLISKSSSPPIR